MAETMFMGLRLVAEGVSRAAFEIRFGVDPARHYAAEIRELQESGQIEMDDKAIRLSRKSLLVSNKVLTAFLPH
jgi:oxygen-independent coproporphyrinogen-3 oxidase